MILFFFGVLTGGITVTVAAGFLHDNANRRNGSCDVTVSKREIDAIHRASEEKDDSVDRQILARICREWDEGP